MNSQSSTSSSNSNVSSGSSLEYTPWQKELPPHIRPYHHTYAASQYHALATDTDIQTFLEEVPLWDNVTNQWISVIKAASIEDLKLNLRDVVDAIVRRLGKSPENDFTTREVHLTDGIHFEHVERYPCTGGTSPDMVVRGTGPSFQDPLRASNDDSHELAFSNITSFFEISQDDDLSNDDTIQVEESAFYARQIFIQQPNRRFVRSLVISEEWCQLFHYDRSGAQYTPPFNIHRDVSTFIRIVLGGGRKVGGTVTVTDVAGVQTQYQLCDVDPIFRRYAILGRGTTGWRVQSPEGVELFVKDCWRPEEDQPEYAILRDLVDVDGVPQMVAYEAQEETTARLRANGNESWSEDKFSNRVLTRVVMEQCGKSIASFQSQKQLICAMRDAIAAHQILVNAHDVLHRDVSQNNILLGGNGARIGERGKLIDFDMAFRGPRPLGQTPKDIKAGTPFYTSVSMLYSRCETTGPHTPFHDQLDDLESFYYVLYDLMFTWAAVGTPVTEPAKHFRHWTYASTSDCALFKRSHFVDKPKVNLLSPFWSPATAELLTSFHAITREMVIEKDELRDLDDVEVVQLYRSLLSRADEFYTRILAVLDKAIDALEQDPSTTSPATPNVHPSSSSPNPSSQDTACVDGALTLPSTASPLASVAGALDAPSVTSKVVCTAPEIGVNEAPEPSAITADEEARISDAAAASIAVLSGACVGTTTHTKHPNSRKRLDPMDIDDDADPKGKRVRLTSSRR